MVINLKLTPLHSLRFDPKISWLKELNHPFVSKCLAMPGFSFIALGKKNNPLGKIKVSPAAFCLNCLVNENHYRER
jgi:hypothetical protein